jgi:ubiquitin-protein ligase
MQIQTIESLDDTPTDLGGCGRSIMKEINDLAMDCPDWFRVSFPTQTALDWEVAMHGPTGTPYEGEVFRISIKLPRDYPFKPPKVNCLTRVYHPNISTGHGGFHLDILKDDSSPSAKIHKVITACSNYLAEPDADNPSELEIRKQFKDDYNQFCKTAREWTEKYAKEL